MPEITQNKILDFLRHKQEYVSGEEISQRLKISRQALWKHIQELKNAGYDILAVPHLGYCLVSSPDRLFPAEVAHHLHTKFIGKRIYYFDNLSSTMDIATQLGIKGLPEGTLVLSEAQSRGRGRLGRNWLSPKYKGIYLSLILRPKILPVQTPILTLLAAVSVCEAIKEVAGLDARIKWPNDIILSNKKLGGILTELNAEMDEVRFIIIGIGINVNNDKNTLIPTATSLREEKKAQVNRITLLKEILRKLETNYLILQDKGSEVISEKWRVYAITLGRRVKIICQKKHLEGQAIDIDNDGALLLRLDSGLIERVTSGDILHCR